MAPCQNGEARRPVVRPDWNQGYVTWGARRRLSSMSNSIHQSPFQLALGRRRSRVRNINTYCAFVTDYIYYRYLYYHAFGIDACFRFKRRQVSNYERDPALGPGYAYLVEWNAYKEYLDRFPDQKEVRRLGSQRTVLTNMFD